MHPLSSLKYEGLFIGRWLWSQTFSGDPRVNTKVSITLHYDIGFGVEEGSTLKFTLHLLVQLPENVT